MKSPWIEVADKFPPDGERVDVWFEVWASALSFGMADSWCEPNAWRESGDWFHIFKGKKARLNSRYISHWKPLGPTDVEEPSSIIWQAVGLAQK